MTDKTYITADQLLDDSFRLGARILESGYRPNFIVGIWRGGTPVGIAVQELLDWFGIETDHIAIRTSLYTGIDERARQVRVHGTSYLIRQLEHGDRLLIVDDVFDSGRSIDAVIAHLQRRCRRNMPGDVRIATAYYKPGKNQTDRVPDYFVHRTEDWLVLPYELNGLTLDEIRAHKPFLAPILDGITAPG